MKELRLMKGNEAVAEAAIRCGSDAYFGYPITPQSEIMEYLTAEKTEERTGMIVLQAESEIAAINMVYGAAGCGKKVLTSSSGPGISLMQEGLSYIAGAGLPCLIVDIMRGGPGLGTIQPSQADYFQVTKGGGHGDYRVIVLAPASVQEMCDFVGLGYEIAFKYRNPVMILADGIIGQMMEKVELPEPQARTTEVADWCLTGKPNNRERRLISSLELHADRQEKHCEMMQAKYREVVKNEIRYEKIECDDAEYLCVAFGSCARICQKTVEMAREKGIKLGLIRPISLYPYPYQVISDMCKQVKGILTVEMNAGQMVEDVRLASNGQVKVEYYGRMGGMIPSPDEVLEAVEKMVENQF
jgi:2-oxoglutarate/2-oxoacid ferredoxin oxidoreductase subunit alpha